MTLSQALLTGGALVVAATIALRILFRRDLARWHARLEGVERRLVTVPAGTVEIAEHGDGPPILVSHGIFHGSDGGLTAVRSTITGRRVLSPSRFGYLGSTMPTEPTAAAQADAFAEMLDALDLASVDVIGISAGTSAAVQMALRHPARVDHLIISSGSWPGSPSAVAPPRWASAFYSDGVMWMLRTLAPPFIRRLMGVPNGFPRDAAEAAEVETMLDSIFPIGPRRPGAIFDAFVSNPEISEVPLEDIAVPTLIVHAADDPLAAHDAAVRAAQRIDGATFVSLDSGGHLGLGQAEQMRAAIAAFLAVPSKR